MTSTVYKTLSSQSLPTTIPCEKDGDNNLLREGGGGGGGLDDGDNSYEVLRRKKQALQETLNLKLLQLKSLCLKEADIIGELPPETPLDPGEPVPHFRKRVGAEFNLNQSFLSKAKTLEEEHLAKLELELELQRKIVKANLKLSNEVNLKKSVKKQRLQNYQDAVLKLKELEKKLFSMRKKMDEGNNHQYESEKARSEINYSCKNAAPADRRPKSSLALVSVNQFDDNEDEDEDGDSDPGDSYLSTSAPSTPAKFRVPERHIRPISPPMKRYDIRPSSVHLPFAKESENNENQPERCKTAEHFSRDYDVESCSIGSGSSCESSIFRYTNDKKRKNILSLLQSHNSDESLDVVTSHLYTLPKRNAPIDSLKLNHGMEGSSEKSINSSSAGNSYHMGVLTRHDSLENTRRKSYVSAIHSHTPRNFQLHHQHGLYQNHGVLTEACEDIVQPDLIPESCSTPLMVNTIPSSINMASRPLPPPPSPSCSSPSSRASPSPHNVDNSSFDLKLNEATLYQNIPDIGKVASNESKPDISSKAVRSSIIRTPIAITVSTSSTDSSQLNPRLPTPAPSLPPRTSSIAGSATPSHNEESIFFAAKATTFSPDQHERSHSTMPSPKVWGETDLDSHPGKSESKYENKPENFYYNEVPVPVAEPVQLRVDNNYENLESDQVDSILIRSSSNFASHSKIGSRPLSIPMSPTLPSPANGVEVNVVSVGHFQPYWEETKPYELSDFFKYSAKHRKKAAAGPGNRASTTSNCSNTMATPIPSTMTTPSSNKTSTTNIQTKGAISANNQMFRDSQTNSTSGRSNGLLNSNLSNRDNLLKTDSYRGDNVNWYENDVIKNPTIV